MSAKHSNAPDFSQVMASDRHRLQQQFQRLPKDDQGKAAAAWLERFNASSEKVAERARLIPKIIYPDALPIADKLSTKGKIVEVTELLEEFGR